MFGVLAAALALGVPLALALPEPDLRFAGAGGSALSVLLGAVMLGLVPLAVAGILDSAAAPSGSSRCAIWWRSAARPSSR